MSRQQLLFKRVNAATGLPAFVDINSLSWEVLLDSRRITPVADNAALLLWPDTSGNGRDANPAVPGPNYRTGAGPAGSPNRQALVDFNAAGRQMFGALPVGGLDPSLGFSLYAYYLLDAVPATGAFDSQVIAGDDIINGFRMFASSFVSAGVTQPAMVTGTTVRGGSLAATGRHTLAVICHPPSGGTGVCEVWQDSALAAVGTWSSMQPQTTYLVSGNAGQNITLQGRLGMWGIGRRDDNPHTRFGVENFLRATWG